MSVIKHAGVMYPCCEIQRRAHHHFSDILAHMNIFQNSHRETSTRRHYAKYQLLSIWSSQKTILWIYHRLEEAKDTGVVQWNLGHPFGSWNINKY